MLIIDIHERIERVMVMFVYTLGDIVGLAYLGFILACLVSIYIAFLLSRLVTWWKSRK